VGEKEFSSVSVLVIGIANGVVVSDSVMTLSVLPLLPLTSVEGAGDLDTGGPVLSKLKPTEPIAVWKSPGLTGEASPSS
jgi:hypothetical protein